MSTHVDSVTLAKRSGDNAVELQVFHVQVILSANVLCRAVPLYFPVWVDRWRGCRRTAGKETRSILQRAGSQRVVN